tara:strand:+ start:58 stop:1782 length:1725 start_codon:yes stop_codon:yes gene_type:complete
MINFIIILIIIIINIAVVDSFGSGNNFQVDSSDIIPTEYIRTIRFDNGNYAIILMDINSVSRDWYYYLFDSNGHIIVNEKKILSTDIISSYNSGYTVSGSNILDAIKIDNDNFFIRFAFWEEKESSIIEHITGSMKFNIYGDSTSDFNFITNKCNYWQSSIPETIQINDNSLISVFICRDTSSNYNSYVYGIKFSSDGDFIGEATEIFTDSTVSAYHVYSGYYHFKIEALSNGGFVICASTKTERNVDSVMKIFNSNSQEVKEVIINRLDTSEKPSDCFLRWNGGINQIYLLDVFPKSFDNGFILIIKDLFKCYNNNIYNYNNKLNWLSYDNDGNQISDRALLSDNINCEYSKIIQVSNSDSNYYLSCDGFSNSYSININSNNYQIKFIDSNELDVYNSYLDINGLSYFSFYDTRHVYLSRYDVSNIESISKIETPTSETEADFSSLSTNAPTKSPTSNSGVGETNPNNDDNVNEEEPEEDRENNPEDPEEDQDEDQDETDPVNDNQGKSSDNNLGIIIGFLVLCIIIIGMSIYIYYGKIGCYFQTDSFRTTKMSLGEQSKDTNLVATTGFSKI